MASSLTSINKRRSALLQILNNTSTIFLSSQVSSQNLDLDLDLDLKLFATSYRSFNLVKHCLSSRNGLGISGFAPTSIRSISLPTSTVMASAFKPEEARVPPEVPPPAPPVTKFKIALCQLAVTTDKEKNIAHARQVIEEAAAKGAKLILLPEIWNSPYSNDSFPVYAEDIDAGGDASPSTAMLSELSHSLKITIVGGSIPERSGDRLYNTCCVFDTDGKLKAKHRKIHLFDIDIPGKMTFKESKTLTAGETPTIVDTGLSSKSIIIKIPPNHYGNPIF